MGYETRFYGRLTITSPEELPPCDADWFDDKIADPKDSVSDFLDRFPSPVKKFGGYNYIYREGQYLYFDDGKFYSPGFWLNEVINYLTKAGHVVSGRIRARGEEAGDHWSMIVVKNVFYRLSHQHLECEYKNDIVQAKLVPSHGNDTDKRILNYLIRNPSDTIYPMSRIKKEYHDVSDPYLGRIFYRLTDDEEIKTVLALKIPNVNSNRSVYKIDAF